MHKNLLLKYICGNTSAAETGQVLDWVGQSEENAQYFTRLMNLWVSQNMPQKEASDEELAEIYRIIAKTEQPSAKKNLYISRMAAWIGAACLVVIGGLGFWLGYNREIPQKIAGDYSEKHDARRLFYTDNGVKGSIVLPDSSVVWLNSGSKLWYPDNFGADKRDVLLSGEGYFEVKHDPDRPMVVSTSNNFRVEVLGTTFNLKSYEDDNVSVATLYSGSVNIIMNAPQSGGEAQVRQLQPNESIAIYRDNTNLLVSKDTLGKNSAWKDGHINFDSTPVYEAIKTLERWHGVTFEVSNHEVLNYRLTADFEAESIVQIMDLIRMTSFIDYHIEGKKVFLKKR